MFGNLPPPKQEATRGQWAHVIGGRCGRAGSTWRVLGEGPAPPRASAPSSLRAAVVGP